MKTITKLLHEAEQTSRAIFANQPRPFGANRITIRRYEVICAIADHPSCSQTDLVNATKIDRSTLAGLVKKLANDGLLKRERRADDSREYSVTLTEKGHTALEAMRPVADVANSKLLDLLDKKERDVFMKALEKLADVSLSVYAV